MLEEPVLTVRIPEPSVNFPSATLSMRGSFLLLFG
jgi:hypothetical protein